MGIKTALEFARMPEQVVKKHFTKATIEIWYELRGQSVCPVVAEEKSTYASISKTRTFAPSTSDTEYLFARLLRNLESAYIKARRYKLSARRIALYLKTDGFLYHGSEMRLNRPTAYPIEIADVIRDAFLGLYQKGVLYSATGVVLMEMSCDLPIQYSLFDDTIKAEKVQTLYAAMDEISRRFGKHTLHLGGSHAIEVLGKGKRGDPTSREKAQLPGETKRRHLGLPILRHKI